ncbi:hypothetical protein [Prosthecobacter sp.]|uniref:hypothetical protein n=1 Tax=Prosthecobacter sp. TaxID=1965333 RepID=UPI0037847AC0
MKHIFATLIAFIALTALASAQVDPLLQSAVQQALPPQWAVYGPAIGVGLMALGRFLKSLANGRSFGASLLSIFTGDNTPTSAPASTTGNRLDLTKLGAAALLLSCTMLLASCGSAPDGQKTFIGATGTQWFNIGKGVFIRETPVVYGEVMQARELTSAKQPLTNVKP